MQEKTAAVVLAAGKGKRMNSDVPKQFMLLREKPVLYYSLQTFQDSFVDEIILVTEKGEEEYCRKEIVDKYHLTKVKHITAGGTERYFSVANGLEAVSEDCAYIFIHDGARPFVTGQIINDALENVRVHKACVGGDAGKGYDKNRRRSGFCSFNPQKGSRLDDADPPGISGVPDPGGIPQAYQGRRKAAYRGNSDHG